jgi:hypothetical protein
MSRAKGNKARRRAIEMLEQDGFQVAIVERTGKFIKDKDMFGLFDLVAIQEYNLPLFIQVTCNKPHTHKKYFEFDKKYGKQVQVLQLVWMDRKGFVNYIYNNNKFVKVPLYEINKARQKFKI